MVIGYLRVSTGKQYPANQKNEIIRFAKGRGLKVEKWVTEIVSGKTKGSERGRNSGGKREATRRPASSSAIATKSSD